MSEQFDAIYDNGVLRPVVPLALPDKTRVKLTVEPQPGKELPDEAAIPGSATRESVVSDSGTDGNEFDSELNALLFDGPNLPADFSRADIYADHD